LPSSSPNSGADAYETSRLRRRDDVRADDQMRPASAPFAMGRFALRGLAQSIARELATCLDQVPKKKYRRAAKETGLVSKDGEQAGHGGRAGASRRQRMLVRFPQLIA
jgi:hypothetical protein